MKVAIKTGFGRPVVKANAIFIGRITLGHPVRLWDVNVFEKLFEVRSGTFAHTDDTHFSGFDQGNADVLLTPMFFEQSGGDPACCSTAKNNEVFMQSGHLA